MAYHLKRSGVILAIPLSDYRNHSPSLHLFTIHSQLCGRSRNSSSPLYASTEEAALPISQDMAGMDISTAVSPDHDHPVAEAPVNADPNSAMAGMDMPADTEHAHADEDVPVNTNPSSAMTGMDMPAEDFMTRRMITARMPITSTPAARKMGMGACIWTQRSAT